MWSGSTFGMCVVLKDKAHGVERYPSKLEKFVALMSIGARDSRSTLSRISFYIGLVQWRSKMEIWADMFPRCLRILYCALDGAGAAGLAMLNLVLLVVTTHSVFGPWMLMTFTEGLV